MASKRHGSRSQTFSSRAESDTVPALSSYLLSLISIKQSNLCVSADVHTTSALLRLAEEVGDSICVLKTHADIIDDFSDRTIKGLQEIATRKCFLIFEDRKFGDIGIQSQYTRGPMRIATWAHLTNAHIFPGPALIPTLQSAATSTLISLNQSVSTEISTGTPRSSIDGGGTTETDTEESTDPSPTTTTTSPKKKPSSAANLLPSSQPGSSSSFFNRPLSPADVDMSHRRTSIVTATTTISQTYEPSPPNPATLSRTLSSSSDPAIDRPSALAQLGPPPHARGLLLLAQMSSQDNMFTPAYTSACVSAARAHKDFVLGFVAQEDLNGEEGDEFLVFTPGVALPEGAAEGGGGDGMGQ
ncbi:MAG: hypothetical protein Q9207_008524, partial [Kuettlingeria erythrocarpa]